MCNNRFICNNLQMDNLQDTLRKKVQAEFAKNHQLAASDFADGQATDAELWTVNEIAFRSYYYEALHELMLNHKLTVSKIPHDRELESCQFQIPRKN